MSGKPLTLAQTPGLTLRAMTESARDIDGAQRLSQGAGWPYRREDWRLALALGQGLLTEAEGEIVASALWWPYDDHFATCGNIIVAPAMQGRGLGRRLMERVLDATGDRRVLLNATEAGRPLYESLGFEAIGTVHQHRGPVAPLPADAAGETPVRAAREADWPAIGKIDRRAFGARRDALIGAFARIGSAAVIERGGALQGYALCRPFGLGQTIGPVIARDAADARRLIGHLLAEHAGQVLRLDITGDSGLGDWLTARGLAPISRVTTMIRGPRPHHAGPERIFALASQSFG